MDHVTHSIETDNRFSIIPHWVIFSGISDGALRLYAVLMKYADGSTGQAFPSRATLAKAMNKKSVRSIDGYLRELRDVGALAVQRRRRNDSKENWTNLYTVKTEAPHCVKQTSHGDHGSSVTHGASDLEGVVQNTALPRAEDCAENHTHSTTPTIVSPSNESRNEIVSPRVLASKTPSMTISRNIKAEEADPLGSEWYYSEERQLAIAYVMKMAVYNTRGEPEMVEDVAADLESFLTKCLGLDEGDSGIGYLMWDMGWTPPKKATEKLEAAIWLNKFLYALRDFMPETAFTPLPRAA